MNSTRVVLLAAGASSRMGTLKALLPWKGVMLIEERVQTLLRVCPNILVVLGCGAEEILPLLEKMPVQTLYHPHWEDGMGSSIACAARYLKEEENSSVLFTAVDQPLVDEEHLTRMIQAFQLEPGSIVVSESAEGWKGIPVLFDARYLNELAQVNGDAGASPVVKQHASRVVPCLAGDKLSDMDTPESYAHLKALTHQ